jgi:DNA-binding YbaB/EbfC family protein
MKGMPPMGGNMNNLLKQAQKLQKQMEDMKEEIEKRTVEASSGGGAVTAVVTGKRELVDIKIKQEVVDPDDVEMLQDLILAAINEALTKANEMMEQEMAKVTGGLSMPGLF